MGTVVMKDVLKCAKIRLGGLSVMTSGPRKMPTWLADKLDSLVLVSRQIMIINQYCRKHVWK